MIIKSIRVQNFRSILDQSLPCDQLTVLVGPNGSGKSSLLRALDLFYSITIKVGPEDFYAEDTDRPIEITVTFTDLDAQEAELFKPYVEGGDLSVVRVVSLADGETSATYHGSSLQCSDFTAVRSAGTARDVVSRYTEIRTNPKYTDLLPARSKETVLDALATWESTHPEECARHRDDGQFFGFKEVARGYLGRHTRFILIPAVRDAADDAAEGKGSPITQILDLVVRHTLAGRRDLAELKEHTLRRYKEIVDPITIPEIRSLASDLTTTLRTYVPNAQVDLSWLGAQDIEIPLPKANVRLVEDGFPSSVARTGHGLQRAFILTMLQHLTIASARRTQEAPVQPETSEQSHQTPSANLPNLILGIEEPELYQHPSRQRHFAKVLFELASGGIPGVARRTQVIHTSHSPLFVGIDRFDQVRLLRKVSGRDGKPKISTVIRATLDQVAEALWEAAARPMNRYTRTSLMPRLQAIMTPLMNEGFFADAIVLVEGEEDRAAILGMAFAMRIDLESEGVAVIPCGGKPSLDRPAIIFRQMEIPTYVVWDSDEGGRDPRPEDNRRLLRIMGQSEEDWPAVVSDRFACFRRTLRATVRDEIGPAEFDQLVHEICATMGINKYDQGMKNSSVVHGIIACARERSMNSPTLEGIIQKILALKR